jgi:hypothetical protein
MATSIIEWVRLLVWRCLRYHLESILIMDIGCRDIDLLVGSLSIFPNEKQMGIYLL